MRLYIPIFYGEQVFTDCEIKKPSPGVIADTVKFIDENKIGMALLTFVSGSIIELKDNSEGVITSKEKIRTICRSMKQKCMEDLAIDIMLLLDPQDGVEGVYNCPRCRKQKICEKKDEIDTRDFLSSLNITYFESKDDYWEIELTEPYERKENGEGVEVIGILGFRYPTITDFIEASARHGFRDQLRLQYQIYAACLMSVNNSLVEKQWKQRWAMLMFENLPDLKTDFNRISKELNNYGRATRVKKVCEDCGKEWYPKINTANFFDSGLRPDQTMEA